jgi:HK97 family phage major capsid protein
MPVSEQTVEQIAADVKKFGDTAAGLQAMNDNAKRELGELRAEIDKHGKKLDVISAEKIDKIAASVEAQDAALAGLKALPEQMDKIEAVLKRPGGGWAGEEATKDAKAAFEFAKARAVARGELKAGSKIEANAEDLAAYEEAFPHYMRARGDNALKAQFMGAMQTGSDPDGGYLVTPTYSTRTITRIYETSNLRALASVESIAGKEISFPRDEGEMGFGGWVGEQTAPSESATAQLGESKIFAHEMYVEPRVTQSMIEDAGLDIEAWVANKVGEKMGRIEATAFFTGTGVNQPRGLLTYAAWATSGDDGHLENGKIEQIVSGGATTLTSDAFYNVAFGLKDAYTLNANWLMKRITVRDVMKLKDGQNNYLWQMGDFKSGQPSTLLSFPVVRTEDMPTIAASSLSVAFGDFKAAYTIVDRLGITLLRDNLTAKPYVKFYNRRRVGGDVVNFEAVKLMKTST